MKRSILSSINDLANLLTTHPALYSIPAFSGLKTIVANAQAEAAKCNCKGKADVINKLKGHCEGALMSLSAADKAKMKVLLNIDQLCYYTRNAKTKKLELTCF